MDVLYFSSVIDNLIENAIKYTTNQSIVVNIVVADLNNKLIISVEDKGIGISEKDQKLIFKPYYRIKRQETKHKLGLGMGLAYAKSIIEAHGGSISLHSILGKGSTFIITI